MMHTPLSSQLRRNQYLADWEDVAHVNGLPVALRVTPARGSRPDARP